MEEWQQVETKTITLMRRLSPDQIKKVQLKHISGVLLEKVALWLLVGSIITLLAALLIGKEHPIMFGIEYQIMFLACFTGWLAATGALGSTAFIYVNALSIQVDPTVDITSRTLVILRLNLGALFAVILSLPFGYKSFQTFSEILFDTQKSMGVNDSVLLLLPFIMGFSTPLVLAILGRFIQGAGTLFGLPHATLSQDPKPGDNGDVQLARLTSNPARSDPSGLSAVGFSAAATRAAGSR